MHPCPTTEQGRGVATRFTSSSTASGTFPIAALTVIFNAADPNNDAAAMVLLTAAALIRWSGIETLRGDKAGLLSGILLDAGLGLMAANTIAFWI